MNIKNAALGLFYLLKSAPMGHVFYGNQYVSHAGDGVYGRRSGPGDWGGGGVYQRGPEESMEKSLEERIGKGDGFSKDDILKIDKATGVWVKVPASTTRGEREYSLQKWEKYGKSRVYLHQRRDRRDISMGWIDRNTGDWGTERVSGNTVSNQEFGSLVGFVIDNTSSRKTKI